MQLLNFVCILAVVLICNMDSASCIRGALFRSGRSLSESLDDNDSKWEKPEFASSDSLPGGPQRLLRLLQSERSSGQQPIADYYTVRLYSPRRASLFASPSMASQLRALYASPEAVDF
ncbi:hypothetical protein DdX_07591 [Ditylenchus destructor]|uniref:Uncharacterized protein n=1 Tax=Ditylenchus destructor TaxID=166010 RepID=A0AAD4N7W7_9BILA|nr:hypothetical protein DdX_07591 [Ditylenchus destructor]